MSALKELRLEKGLTQKQVASQVGVSLRTYKYYENDATKQNSLKYNYVLDKLKEINKIDENHGIISIKYITEKCKRVLDNYEVEYCILFGSYSKGCAMENSDVDLLLSANVSGIKFFGLIEEIRQALNKKVDVLNVDQLKDNFDLTKEILRDGIKIYG